MSKIGKNICRLRVEKNMTQDDLAKQLFVSRQTVSNYETGRSDPDIDTILKIAALLDSDANALLYGAAKPKNRTKELRRLFLFVLVLVVSAALWAWVQPSFRLLYQRFYCVSLLLLTKNLLVPAWYLLLGYTIMCAAGCLLKGAPPTMPHWLRKVIIGILCLYLILQLPYFISMMQSDYAFYLAQKARIDYSRMQTYSFFPAWDFIALPIAQLAFRCPALFALPGAALWLTKPAKQSVCEEKTPKTDKNIKWLSRYVSHDKRPNNGTDEVL